MDSTSRPSHPFVQFEIERISESEDQPEDNPGYIVTSSAPINVEDSPLYSGHQTPEQALEAQATHISNIANYLIDRNEPQLIVAVHGYAIQRGVTKNRYQQLYKYANKNLNLNNYVLLGYLWPAENPLRNDPEPNNDQPISFLTNLIYAIQSLPTLLSGIIVSSLVLGTITALLLVFLLGSKQSNWFNILSILLSISIFSIISTTGLLKWGDTLKLLPNLPVVMLIIGLILGGSAIFNFWLLPAWSLVPLLVLFVIAFTLIFTLIVLRLITYLRDNYRATNFGVFDLVELIRQVERAVFVGKILEERQGENLPEKVFEEMEVTREHWQVIDRQTKIKLWLSNNPDKITNRTEIEKNPNLTIKTKIKLTFIAHSMGCFVVTNTVRILSDVFAANSLGKIPYREIGRVFSLGRLILVAPDIPTETIMTRRANFLSYSLSRCEEAYIFSNEGDLALRLGSTAANYFSFPAKKRSSGYKLGNLTVKHFECQQDHHTGHLTQQNYGIVNYKDGIIEPPHSHLEIRASNQEHWGLDELEQDFKEFPLEERVADIFTYFDCTDYMDLKDEPTNSEQEEGEPKGIVSYALSKSALNLWDYASLSLAFLQFGIDFPGSNVRRDYKGINVHGGYFNGKFSQELICKLAFLGLRDFLETLEASRSTSDPLDTLSEMCREKQIQVVLSSKAPTEQG